MLTSLVAGAITFYCTALLTVSGVGAAFVLVPVFVALGVEVHQAMATSLLLNALSMAAASIPFFRKRLVVLLLIAAKVVFDLLG